MYINACIPVPCNQGPVILFYHIRHRYFTARMMNQLLKFIMITNYNVVRDQGTAIVESELIIF